MNMKNEWKWWSAFGVISILVIGGMSSFRFGELTIQRHDTFFTIHSVRAIIYLTVFLATVRNLYLLTELATGRYKIMALLVAIINPIVALFLIILVYMDVQAIMAFREIYPGINLLQQLAGAVILAGVIILHIAIELSVLKKLRTALNTKQ